MFQRLLARQLDHGEAESLVAREVAQLATHCQPMAIFLFGSAARGTMTDASDIDLLAVLADDADFKAVKSAYYRRRGGGTWPVDVVFMSRADFLAKSRIGGVAMQCLREGRLVHGVSP